MGPSTDTSHFFTQTANQTNQIQLLQPDGFQVGTAPQVNAKRRSSHVRRLGACGADSGPHGRHERPPHGRQASSSSGARGTKSTTWASTSTAGATTAVSASAPVHSPAPACWCRPASRWALAIPIGGPTTRRTPVLPTSSTGWRTSISTERARGTVRSDRRQRTCADGPGAPAARAATPRRVRGVRPLRHRLRPRSGSSRRQEVTATAFLPRNDRRRQCGAVASLAASHLWHRPRPSSASGRLPREPP